MGDSANSYMETQEGMLSHHLDVWTWRVMNVGERDLGFVSLGMVLNPGLDGRTWGGSIDRKRGPVAEP